MVPFIYQVESIDFSAPSRSLARRETVVMSLRVGSVCREFPFTFIEPALREHINQVDGVREVHLLCLDPNSLAAHLLPGRPGYLVTGLKASGRQWAGVPAVLLRWRLAGWVATAVLTTAALCLELRGSPWPSLLAGVAATAVAGALRTLPAKPFWGHEDEQFEKNTLEEPPALPDTPNAQPEISAPPDLPSQGAPTCTEG